jgi:hypothetical protein
MGLRAGLVTVEKGKIFSLLGIKPRSSSPWPVAILTELSRLSDPNINYSTELVKEERNILHTIRRKANWIGHVLRRNCLLKHIIEGKIRGTRRRGRTRKQLLEVEGGSSGSHSLENSVWKRLWTCRKTDYYLI